MLTHSTSDFDFEAWVRLAKDDPQGYFRERERVIGAFIDEHPGAREKLLALQAQIDGLRVTAGTPARALAGIAGLLSDHLSALSSHLEQLGQESVRLGRAIHTSR
jgi:hypothetical protein